MDKPCYCRKTHSITKSGVTLQFKKGETYFYTVSESGVFVTVYKNRTNIGNKIILHDEVEYNLNNWDKNGVSQFEKYFDSELKTEITNDKIIAYLDFFYSTNTNLKVENYATFEEVFWKLLYQTFPDKNRRDINEVVKKLNEPDSINYINFESNRITTNANRKKLTEHLNKVRDSGKYEE